MKYTVIAELATVVIILAVMLATACGERVGTVTPAVSPEPSPSAEQPTTLPIPSPTGTRVQTATPKPTRTPVPPTPTPTFGELTVSRLGWYTNEETDQESKSYLIFLLLETSMKYPLLFESLVQKAWLNPADVPADFIRVNEAIDHIRLLARVADNEAAAIKVLNMPFLDSLDGTEWDKYRALGEVVNGGPESFSAFVDYAITKGGFTDSDREVDVYYLYMETQDAAGMERIYSGRLPERRDIFLLKDLVQLHTKYPVAYSAMSEHFRDFFQLPGFVMNVSDLAAIDEQLAQRLVKMPFNRVSGGLDNSVWGFVARAAEADGDAATFLVEKYELQGGADHSALALLLLDAASIFAPDTVETVRTFDWVRDGVDGPNLREEDWGTRAFSSREERTVEAILATTIQNEDWINKLLTKGWIRNDLTSDENNTVNRLRGFGDPVAGLLLDMEFLDEVEREDSLILVPIANFLHATGDSVEFPLGDVLNDERLNGEITDANRHLVEPVINDVLARYGLGTEDD